MIKQEPIQKKILSIEPPQDEVSIVLNCSWGHLECGHRTHFEIIDGKNIQLHTGHKDKNGWKNWTGDEVAAGGVATCWTCSSEEYKAKIRALPPYKAERFDTQEDLRAIHPKAAWEEYGPIHKHGDKYFVQVYFGQHEWMIMNIENVLDCYEDPGFDGKIYGYAYVATEYVRYACDLGVKSEMEPPDRDGKVLTVDMALFADKDKLKEYLGPDDPFWSKAADRMLPHKKDE